MEAGGGGFGTNQNFLILLPFPTTGPILDPWSPGTLCYPVAAISSLVLPPDGRKVFSPVRNNLEKQQQVEGRGFLLQPKAAYQP